MSEDVRKIVEEQVCLDNEMTVIQLHHLLVDKGHVNMSLSTIPLWATIKTCV